MSRRVRPERLLGWSAVAAGVVLTTFVALPLLPVAVACPVGILAVCWVASTQTLLQTNVADSYLGRVFGAFGTTNAVILILGSLLAGGLADTVGVSALLFAAAAPYSVAGSSHLPGWESRLSECCGCLLDCAGLETRHDRRTGLNVESQSSAAFLSALES